MKRRSVLYVSASGQWFGRVIGTNKKTGLLWVKTRAAGTILARQADVFNRVDL